MKYFLLVPELFIGLKLRHYFMEAIKQSIHKIHNIIRFLVDIVQIGWYGSTVLNMVPLTQWIIGCHRVSFEESCPDNSGILFLNMKALSFLN